MIYLGVSKEEKIYIITKRSVMCGHNENTELGVFNFRAKL